MGPSNQCSGSMGIIWRQQPRPSVEHCGTLFERLMELLPLDRPSSEGRLPPSAPRRDVSGAKAGHRTAAVRTRAVRTMDSSLAQPARCPGVLRNLVLYPHALQLAAPQPTRSHLKKRRRGVEKRMFQNSASLQAAVGACSMLYTFNAALYAGVQTRHHARQPVLPFYNTHSIVCSSRPAGQRTGRMCIASRFRTFFARICGAACAGHAQLPGSMEL